MKYKLENVKIVSNKIWISEDTDPDVLFAKVLICDFSVNANGVQLNRKTIDSWLSTLKDAPLVGKIKAKVNGEIDFTSHNAVWVERMGENGESYKDLEFNTDAFGTFTDVSIENIDGADCIVANAKVWKRFFAASNLIKKRIEEGTLSTSWEIAVEDSDSKIQGGALVKTINKGRFIGHCLLGSTTRPAYQVSKVLEVASSEDDEELCSAILNDILESNENSHSGNEVVQMDENENIETSTEKEGVENGEEGRQEEQREGRREEGLLDESSEKKEETSALTDFDIRKALHEAIRDAIEEWPDMLWVFPEEHEVWCKTWDSNETDLTLFTYTVDNNMVTLSDPKSVVLTVSLRNINSEMSAKNDALISANSKIQELESVVSELAPFKEAHEKLQREQAEAEHQKKVAELRTYVEKSKVVKKEEIESGEIHDLIEDLKVAELKSIIADRIVEKENKTTKTETSSVSPSQKEKVDIGGSAASPSTPYEAFQAFLHK